MTIKFKVTCEENGLSDHLTSALPCIHAVLCKGFPRILDLAQNNHDGGPNKNNDTVTYVFNALIIFYWNMKQQNYSLTL